MLLIGMSQEPILRFLWTPKFWKRDGTHLTMFLWYRKYRRTRMSDNNSMQSQGSRCNRKTCFQKCFPQVLVECGKATSMYGVYRESRACKISTVSASSNYQKTAVTKSHSCHFFGCISRHLDKQWASGDCPLVIHWPIVISGQVKNKHAETGRQIYLDGPVS